ncbi:hypothetical protein HQ560_04935 [bacterium]|nr:hypothetical protein [bacterium]
MPIHAIESCIINGAQGGTRVAQHLRNPEDPKDVETIYGRLLWRHPMPVLRGQNGIAALTFCEVPILPAKTASMFFPSPYGSNHMWDTSLCYER